MSAVLWPQPALVDVGNKAANHRSSSHKTLASDFVLVPNAVRPRLLVPTSARWAAAGAVRRYSQPRSRLIRFRSQILSLSFAVGLAPLLMRDRLRVYSTTDGESIETYLRAALERDLMVSMHVGPPRANRKPILQLLTPGGETVGFAKIGINGLTRDLVRAERDSLLALDAAPLRATSVPKVMHYGTWNGLEILVQSALPAWVSGETPAALPLTAAMREIAHIGGTHREPLATSTYWASMHSRLAQADDGDTAGELRAAAACIEREAGETLLAFGSWHGDWAPWNMGSQAHRILVWDWERFATHVPLGFDAVHYRLQKAVVREGRPPHAAVSECMRRAPDLLAPFEVPAEEAYLTSMLYLLDIAVRYLLDGQAEAGARLGALGSWLLPVLTQEVTRLRPHSHENDER